MEVQEIEHGTHPDGVQWRIRLINGLYYYSENISHSEYNIKRWEWVLNYTHTNLENVRNKVASDSRAKEEYMSLYRKGKSNG